MSLKSVKHLFPFMIYIVTSKRRFFLPHMLAGVSLPADRLSCFLRNTVRICYRLQHFFR